MAHPAPQPSQLLESIRQRHIDEYEHKRDAIEIFRQVRDYANHLKSTPEGIYEMMGKGIYDEEAFQAALLDLSLEKDDAAYRLQTYIDKKAWEIAEREKGVNE